MRNYNYLTILINLYIIKIENKLYGGDNFMKKIFLFFSTIIFSLFLFINKNTYAQTYPTNPKQLIYLTHTFDRENAYT